MKYWLIVGTNKYDILVVVADSLRFDGRAAFFESNSGDLVVALNDRMWTSITPITVDEYYRSTYPEIRQKENI